MHSQISERGRSPPANQGLDNNQLDPNSSTSYGIPSTSNVHLSDTDPEYGVASTSSVRLAAAKRAIPAAEEELHDGGLDGWMAVIGGSIVMCVSLGLVQSFGVFQDYYKRFSLTERTPSDISWIGAVQSFFHFASGLPSGKLFDDGHFYTLLTGGSVLYLISFFLLSLAKPHQYYQHLLAQGFGMGIGMGFMAFPALAVLAQYFSRRRSLAMGIVVTGSSVGGAIYPILLNDFFSRWGFAWGVRAVGFINFALILAANVMIRRRLPRHAHAKSVGFKRVLCDWPYMLFVAGALLVLWGIFFPFFYLQFYAASHQLNSDIVKYSLTIMNAASIPGRILPSFLADHYGPFNVIIPSTIISGALIFAMFGATTSNGLITFAVFYGLFSGGFVALCSPIASILATNLSDVGIRIGVLSVGLGLSLLTGNPIAGALLAPPLLTWWRPILFSSVVIFGGALCHIIARAAVVRRRGTSRT